MQTIDTLSTAFQLSWPLRYPFSDTCSATGGVHRRSDDILVVPHGSESTGILNFSGLRRPRTNLSGHSVRLDAVSSFGSDDALLASPKLTERCTSLSPAWRRPFTTSSRGPRNWTESVSPRFSTSAFQMVQWLHAFFFGCV